MDILKEFDLLLEILFDGKLPTNQSWRDFNIIKITEIDVEDCFSVQIQRRIISPKIKGLDRCNAANLFSKN